MSFNDLPTDIHYKLNEYSRDDTFENLAYIQKGEFDRIKNKCQQFTDNGSSCPFNIYLRFAPNICMKYCSQHLEKWLLSFINQLFNVIAFDLYPNRSFMLKEQDLWKALLDYNKDNIVEFMQEFYQVREDLNMNPSFNELRYVFRNKRIKRLSDIRIDLLHDRIYVSRILISENINVLKTRWPQFIYLNINNKEYKYVYKQVQDHIMFLDEDEKSYKSQSETISTIINNIEKFQDKDKDQNSIEQNSIEQKKKCSLIFEYQSLNNEFYNYYDIFKEKGKGQVNEILIMKDDKPTVYTLTKDHQFNMRKKVFSGITVEYNQNKLRIIISFIINV